MVRKLASIWGTDIASHTPALSPDPQQCCGEMAMQAAEDEEAGSDGQGQGGRGDHHLPRTPRGRPAPKKAWQLLTPGAPFRRDTAPGAPPRLQQLKDQACAPHRTMGCLMGSGSLAGLTSQAPYPGSDSGIRGQHVFGAQQWSSLLEPSACTSIFFRCLRFFIARSYQHRAFSKRFHDIHSATTTKSLPASSWLHRINTGDGCTMLLLQPT